jgi:hypothetical protein
LLLVGGAKIFVLAPQICWCAAVGLLVEGAAEFAEF